MRRPLVALAAGVVLALGGAEGALRARYPALPSLAALDGTGIELQPADPDAPYCDAHLAFRANARAWPRRGFGETLRVWFAGDSTTSAVGVPDDTSWWMRVAEGLAAGRALEATNVSVPGAEPCGTLQQLTRRAREAAYPDLVFAGVFADDLTPHQRFSVRQKSVLLPAAAPRWLRPLVARSYAANLAWFALDPRREQVRERAIEPAAVFAFRAATRGIHQWAADHGAQVAFVIHPPASWSECPERPPPEHVCRRMAGDLARMVAMLHEDGRLVLDLRPFFAATPLPPLPGDLTLIAQGQLEMPIHVAEEGQALIAGEVLRLAREARFGANVLVGAAESP